jgi:hypothetical protein
MLSIIQIILIILLVFLIIGVLFTFFFITRGLEKVDEDTKGSTWGFKVIIIPGCILLWPFLLQKWLKANKEMNHD